MSSVTTFFLLLLLMICCALFVFAQYVSGNLKQAAAKTNVELFKPNQKYEELISEGIPSGGGDNSITPTDFYSSFLLSSKDEIIVLTGANCSTDCNKETNVLALCIETGKITELFTTSGEGIASKYNKQIALKQVKQQDKILKFLFAAIHKSKIYILLISNSELKGGKLPIKLEWGCSIITGIIDSSKPKINWETEASPGSGEFSELKKKLEDNTPSNGFVLLKEAGNFIIALQFEKKTDKKIPFAFIQFKEDTGITETFADLEVEEDDCTFKLFAWKEKIMLAKYCGGNKNSMHELQEEKKTWMNTDEPIFFLLNYFNDKNNFIAAKMVNLSVLVFTQKKKGAQCSSDANTFCIDLWMTDGSRLHNVGSIVSSKNDEVISAGLLHTKNQLFLLHQQANQKNIILTNLDDQLGKINTKLKKWKNSNIKVQQLYKDTVTKENTFSTDGLVGFLSGISRDQWTNMYHDFHATLHNNNKKESENSFEFSGKGAGAKWQVGQKNEDQPYKFTDLGFTLVAIVKIGNGTNGKDNSILGVRFPSDTNYVGLLCTNEGNWDVKCKTCQTKVQPQKVACKYDKPYYVALILNNTVISVYVNGEKLPEFYEQQIQISALQTIQDFYFGADSNAEELAATDVTITNVVLYNRPFTEEEVKQLKPKQEDEADNQAIPQGNGGTIPQHNGGKEQIDKPSPETSAEQTVTKNETKEEQSSSSLPLTTEDSAARVGVVGVLCFMLFGVFTLLKQCYVY